MIKIQSLRDPKLWNPNKSIDSVRSQQMQVGIQQWSYYW